MAFSEYMNFNNHFKGLTWNVGRRKFAINEVIGHVDITIFDIVKHNDTSVYIDVFGSIATAMAEMNKR